MSQTENKPAPRMDVELLDDNHQHAGKDCAKGDVINVTKSQGDALIKADRAKPATGGNA